MSAPGPLADRWGLQYRITASVGFGLAVILVLFGYIAFWAVDQATNQAFHERQRLAMLMAHHVEARLADEPRADTSRLQAIVGPLLELPASEGGRLQVEVIDERGAVLVASEPPSTPSGTGSSTAGARAASHAALLADPIAERRPGVRTHAPPNGAPLHVVAYAPLALPDGRPWGLTVEQRQDALLELPRHMRSRMLVVGALALLVASALAWLDARRVVAPLRRVTLAAQRIAAGDLAAPLTAEHPRRRDEVGRLTVALETMRGRLLQSLDEIKEWNVQLERRVRQRTRELAAAGEQRRRLLRKVIWAQEEERKRLARELHDDTVQMLSGLAMTLQAVEDTLPAPLAHQRGRLAWAREQAVHAAREIRQLILGLRPSALDDLGLIPAVRWYAATQLAPLGIQVDFDAPEALPPLPALVQTAAFRVLQEALANVAKHAHARRVVVRVGAAGGALQAAVEDDGHGFDLDALRAAATNETAADADGRGLGLLGMQERILLLDGHLTLRSAPGGGTTVSFSIPLAGRRPDLADEPPASALQNSAGEAVAA